MYLLILRALTLFQGVTVATLVKPKGVLFFLGDDAGFEANTYGDTSIKTKGKNL